MTSRRVGLLAVALWAWSGCQAPERSDDDARLRTLVQSLGADDVETRAEAERALTAYGARAESELSAVLDHGDLELRSRAERILARIRWNRATPILFTRPGTVPSSIFLRDSTTGEERWVIQGSATVSRPWCSPDGKGFLFRRSLDWLVYYSFESGEEQALTLLEPAHEMGVAWSPDGTRILLISSQILREDGSISDDGAPRVQILDLATRKIRVLTPWPRPHWYACWSPDGKRVAYVSGDLESKDAFNRYDLFVIDAAGGEPHRLTWDLAPKHSVAWSPDGRRLAFMWEDPVQVEPGDPSSGSAGPDRVGILDLGTGRAWKITSADWAAESPQWSPDGTLLAFFGNIHELRRDLCVSDADGRNLRVVRTVEGRYGEFSWSPDGRRLLFSEDDGESARIAVVNTDGSDYRPIIQDSSEAVWLPRR